MFIESRTVLFEKVIYKHGTIVIKVSVQKLIWHWSKRSENEKLVRNISKDDTNQSKRYENEKIETFLKTTV